ncbi:5021_t:CDS:2 [Cetraspora pellucida]|uniref:5021_t:CDS:1 n=1 Tax=Cetraspora pellucida TaxID=1433469 RepID=A0A9N9FZL5_9GLOM|nr:5021_t:CDS:2 [Cetraspora pellucida]
MSKNTSEDSIITSVPRSEIEQKLDFYRKKAAVPNTVKAIQTWTKKFNEFRHHYNYITPIETIEDPHLIEYISKTSAIHSLNLHDKYQFPDLHNILNGKIKDLQKREFGEKEGSMALTAQQVKEILSNEFLDSKTLQGLFKNNQQGIQGGNAHCIQLPPDSSDIPGPVSDVTKYISKHPLDVSDNFYLQPNPNWHDTNIWYLKAHCGLNRVGNFMRNIGQKVKIKLPDSILTNHSGRKTAAQILQDVDIPEDAIMNITGHKSSQGLHAYKTVNESQKVITMKTLINTIELASNTNIISQESPTVLTEITESQINFNTNTVTTQDINMVQGQIHSEFQN